MKIVEQFPHAVRELEHLWIPLPDGSRLAARAWLPTSAESAPVPAVVEYIPYGKRDGTRDRDEPMHGWFAGHGYAALRIDLRGSGESDGLLLDEYLPQELQDGADALAWIAAQPWCTGAVGLIGKSWGGFNALQIAALRPPALRAVISVCSTDDRYADDAHYMGGCLLAENMHWGATFFQLLAQPPDPALVGERWRELWHARLAACEPPPARWLRHPLRDAYWRHGSVCEDFARIACPVYAVGGWTDAYTDAIPRLLAGLPGRCRGLIGPWGHQYPQQGWPGPAIGFLQEARRWWDHWLRGVDQGLDAEPALRAWLQESLPAGSEGRERPGRWVAEPGWPPRGERREYALAPGAAPDAPGALLAPGSPRGEPQRLAHRSPQTLGRAGGGFFATGLLDQSADDAASLCFDSEPLAERLEILGFPELRLQLASDRPAAFVVARLCDVAPDGSSTRVSYGALNLTHRDGHTRSEPLEPGRPFSVSFALHCAGHAFPAGHRVRLALSTAYWPLLWPSPQPVSLALWTAQSSFALPLRAPAAADAALPPFEEAEGAAGPAGTQLSQSQFQRGEERDPASGDELRWLRAGYTAEGEIALARYEAVGIEGGDGRELHYRIHPDDPLRARLAMRQHTLLRRGEWQVDIETELELTSTLTHFVLRGSLRARERGGPEFSRDFADEIPRVGL